MPALVAGVACLTAAAAIAVLGARADSSATEGVDSRVNYASRVAENALTQTFERIRTIALILGRDPSFYEAAKDPRPVSQQLADKTSSLNEVNNELRYLPTLLPGEVDSANFADVKGQELTRFAGGRVALAGWLANVQDQLYFGPALTLGEGKVFRSAPYISDQSAAWVVTDSTAVYADGKPVGVLSISVTMDSLRTSIIGTSVAGQTVRVVDPGTGLVVMDSRVAQDALMKGGVNHPVMADDNDFLGRQDMFHTTTGTDQVGDVHLSFATLSTDLESGIDPWVVVASEPLVLSGTSIWVWVLLGVGLVLLGLGVWLTIQSNRSRRRASAEAVADRDRLSERLSEMSDALTRVAAGDLGARLPVEGFDDETLSQMVTSFDRTLVKLRVLVGQAQESGESVARSAAELRVLAGQQADSAGEQSAAVTETTVTIQELAATASQIADSAGAVATVAGEMLALTETGRAAVNDSVGAMDRISDRVSAISTSTTSLGDKIVEIGGILALLDDLSDQTNLLALNAAIEAARAGEHGRGFAVVAGEVRKLAERARQSTGRIQSLVAEIQHLMATTLTASEQGAAEVELGSGLASDAVSVLEQIAGRVEEAATAVKEISVATQQQRSASDQVVVVMTRLSEVSNEYAAGSRQAASSADELAALAETLSTSIDTFSVADSEVEDGVAGPTPVEGWDDRWEDGDWDETVLGVAAEFAALGDDEPDEDDEDDDVVEAPVEQSDEAELDDEASVDEAPDDEAPVEAVGRHAGPNADEDLSD